MSRIHKLLIIISMLVIAMKCISANNISEVQAEGTYNDPGTVSTDKNFANPVKCHLQYNLDGTITMMYSVLNNDVLSLFVKTVNDKGEKIDLKIIPLCGKTWGGCIYKGDDGYTYVATGNGSDALWYFTKFNSDWENVGTAKITGDDSYTYEAYHAGNCEMTIVDDYLIVHAARLRPMTDDGLRHQSNITFYIKTDTMTPLYTTGKFGFDHVSHSFNQFIRADGKRIITVDHGDAYPRSVYLQSWNIPEKITESEKYCKKKNLTLIDINGKIGNNYTGVTVNGFEIGTYNNVVVGTAIPRCIISSDEDGYQYNDNTCNNIYFILVDKTCDSSKTIWLSNYGRGYQIDRMKFLKIDDNDFLILYGLKNANMYYTGYIKVNSKGEILSNGFIEKEFLDASKPAVQGDCVVWCHYIESELGNFMTLKKWNLITGDYQSQNISTEVSTRISQIDVDIPDDMEIDKTYKVTAKIYSIDDLESMEIYPDAIAIWSSSNTDIVEVMREEVITDNGWSGSGIDDKWVHYKTNDTLIKIKNYGNCILTCTVGDKQSQIKINIKKNNKEKIPKLKTPNIQLLKKKTKKSFIVKWKKVKGVSGYQLSFSRTKKFSDNKTKVIDYNSSGKKIVKGLSKGKKYYVRLRTYIDGSEDSYYSKWSKVKTVKLK